MGGGVAKWSARVAEYFCPGGGFCKIYAPRITVKSIFQSTQNIQETPNFLVYTVLQFFILGKGWKGLLLRDYRRISCMALQWMLMKSHFFQHSGVICDSAKVLFIIHKKASDFCVRHFFLSLFIHEFRKLFLPFKFEGLLHPQILSKAFIAERAYNSYHPLNSSRKQFPSHFPEQLSSHFSNQSSDPAACKLSRFKCPSSRYPLLMSSLLKR